MDFERTSIDAAADVAGKWVIKMIFFGILALVTFGAAWLAWGALGAGINALLLSWFAIKFFLGGGA